MNRKIVVLFGEDPGEMDPAVREFLEQSGMVVQVCSSGIDLVRRAVVKKPDIIVINVALARLNGYQCARLLRHEPATRRIPIIHVGISRSPVDRYWSGVCGGDDYLEIPLAGAVLKEALLALLAEDGTSSRPPAAGGSILPEMDDHAIMGLATNLLEHDLLRLNILKEINMVDTMGNTPSDLISSLFAILNSLYPISSGAVMLIYEDRTEYYHCSASENGRAAVALKAFLLDQLRRRQELALDLSGMVDIPVISEISPPSATGHSEISVHIGEIQEPVQIALAFEKVDVDYRSRDEESLFELALDLIRGIIEKKIVLRINQELSVIDLATRGYSITFFMEVLRREMENAARHNYVISLFTVLVSNFSALTDDMDAERLKGFIRSMQTAILRSMRKTDVVARWNQANFAFLLTHTDIAGTRKVIDRVRRNLIQGIADNGVDVEKVRLEIGMCPFDPARDKTPQIFLKSAMPRKNKKTT